MFPEVELVTYWNLKKSILAMLLTVTYNIALD